MARTPRKNPGYRLIQRDGVRRYAHRVIAEDHLGRPLGAHEHVHHINGDIRDNRPENLQIVSAGEHVHIHLLGRPLKPDLRARIVALRNRGLRVCEIAASVGRDPSTVSRHLRAAAGRPRPRWNPEGGQ